MVESTGGPAASLRGVFGWIRLRLRARTDSEHMMSLNRLVFCCVFAVFLATAKTEGWREGLVVTGAGVAITALIFCHILYSPAPSPSRRLLAMLADNSVICFEMHLGGAATSLFYPLILWTAFGNGLRFGLPSLLRATIMGFVGFAFVVATTPFWQEYASLTTGLMVGLVLLPCYAMVLLRSLSAAKKQAEAAKMQAEAANEAKTLFLARVSHELRTPLHAIIGTGSLFETTELSRPQQEMAKTIMDASHSLLALIEDLLQTSAIESGKFQFNAAEFETLDLLNEVRALVLVAAVSKGLRVAAHLGRGVPPRVSSDQRRLREIMLNLTGNALKFTETGGVLLSITLAANTARQVRLRFEVADTGIGIADAAHETIFKRFVQADQTIHDQFGGTGLGLAICKQLVETMGGQIGVRSKPGAGSVFWFEIDCLPAADLPTLPRASATRIIALDLDAASARTAQELADRWNASVRHEQTDAATLRRVLAMSAGEGGPLVLFSTEPPGLRRAVLSAITDIASDRLPAVVAIEPNRTTDDMDSRWAAATTIARDATADEFQAAAAIALGLGGVKRDGAERPASVAVARRSRHVLVVDDSRINQQVMSRILESGGHTFALASDGEAALDALEATAFDLVLMDVNMKGMDGIETTKLYRFTALGQRHVPIMALTADATPEMAQRCLEAGMDRCIIKPVHADTMLAIIDRLPVPDGATDDASGEASKDADARPPRAARAALQPLASDIAVFDTNHLDSLRDLGGQEFVSQLIEDFAGDARVLVETLLAAIERNDLAAFRAHAHAIASASGNLGASRVRQLGLAMERFSAEEFGAYGLTKARELEREVACLTEAAGSTRLAVS